MTALCNCTCIFFLLIHSIYWLIKRDETKPEFLEQMLSKAVCVRSTGFRDLLGPPLLPCGPDAPCGDLAFPSCAARPGLSETPGTLSGTVQDQPPGRCENVRHQAGPEHQHPGPFMQHLGCTKARWFGCAVVGTVVLKQQDAHPLCALRGLSRGSGLPAAPSSSPPAPHRLYKARQTLPSPGGQLLGTKRGEKGKL